MLVLDGHKNHEFVEFQVYDKKPHIISRGLTPYSSYLTQSLDIEHFSVLKRAYGRKIEAFI